MKNILKTLALIAIGVAVGRVTKRTYENKLVVDKDTGHIKLIASAINLKGETTLT